MKKTSLALILSLLLTLFAGCKDLDAPASSASSASQTSESKRVDTDTSESRIETTSASVTPDTAPESTVASTQEPEVDPDAVHPMLFRVTGEDGQEGYLFGTIHIGDRRIQTALEKLQPYLDTCDALAVEFDLVAYSNDIVAQFSDMDKFVLHDDTMITDHMPEETYKRVCDLLEKAGLKASMMKKYNLAMWSQLVTEALMKMQDTYDFENGMDRTLIQYCYDKNIEVRDVESAELQFGMLIGFPDELHLLLIEQTLNQADQYVEALDKLYTAWLKGEPEQIETVLNEESEEDATLTDEEKALIEEYNNQMLTQRNLGMRDRALEWLKAGDKVFFAVGAAHLVNEDGLIALLRAEGYTVEQISY